MRIGFDLDGTFTNFEKFVLDNAIDFMQKNYGMSVKNKYGYDIDQVFDVANVLMERGLSKEQAIMKSYEVTSHFWEKFYISYSLLTPFRKYVKETIDKLINDGHEVYIFTSRKKTCEDSLIGKIVRSTTKMQFLLNKTKYTKIMFFASDEEKLKALSQYDLAVMVDDKPELIEEIDKFTKVICINSSYNINHNIPESSYRANGYENYEVYNLIKKIIEKDPSLDKLVRSYNNQILAPEYAFSTVEMLTPKTKVLKYDFKNDNCRLK